MARSIGGATRPCKSTVLARLTGQVARIRRVHRNSLTICRRGRRPCGRSEGAGRGGSAWRRTPSAPPNPGASGGVGPEAALVGADGGTWPTAMACQMMRPTVETLSSRPSRSSMRRTGALPMNGCLRRRTMAAFHRNVKRRPTPILLQGGLSGAVWRAQLVEGPDGQHAFPGLLRLLRVVHLEAVKPNRVRTDWLLLTRASTMARHGWTVSDRSARGAIGSSPQHIGCRQQHDIVRMAECRTPPR